MKLSGTCLDPAFGRLIRSDYSNSNKKNVKLAPFCAHLRAFLNHAQLNKGDTVRRLLTENGVPASKRP